MPKKEVNSQVRINVTNLHFAKIQEAEDGSITFDAPERIIGAEQVGRIPSVASGRLYGDGIVRFNVNKKTAYELTLNANNIPSEWRAYIEGTNISESGVESATSGDLPKPLAIGWEVEKTGNKSEFVWFPYCVGSPVEQTTQQSEDNINYSRDQITLLAMEHNSIKRFYTLVDQEIEGNEEVTAEKFFSKVQITDTIEEATGA